MRGAPLIFKKTPGFSCAGRSGRGCELTVFPSLITNRLCVRGAGGEPLSGMMARCTASAEEQRQEVEYDTWLFPQCRRKPRGPQENKGELPGNLYNFKELGKGRSPMQTGQGARKVGPVGPGQIEIPGRPDRPVVRRFGNRETGGLPAKLNHAPDADTRQCAKNAFRLIQAVHHRSIIKTL